MISIMTRPMAALGDHLAVAVTTIVRASPGAIAVMNNLVCFAYIAGTNHGASLWFVHDSLVHSFLPLHPHQTQLIILVFI